METGNENATTHLLIALRERRNVQNAVFSEVTFGKNHALYVHLSYKDVDPFRNGTVQELSCFCYDMVLVTNEPYTSLNYENGKPITIG